MTELAAFIGWLLSHPSALAVFVGLPLAGVGGLWAYGRQLAGRGVLASAGFFVLVLAAGVYCVRNWRAVGVVVGVFLGVTLVLAGVVVWHTVPALRWHVIVPAAVVAWIAGGVSLMLFMHGEVPAPAAVLDELDVRDHRAALKTAGGVALRAPDGSSLGRMTFTTPTRTPLGVTARYRAPGGMSTERIETAALSGELGSAINASRTVFGVRERARTVHVIPSDVIGEGTIIVNELDPLANEDLLETVEAPLPPEHVHVGRVVDLSDPAQPRIRPVTVPIDDMNILVAGNPGAGKSTFVAHVLNQIDARDHHAQVLCDPKMVEFQARPRRASLVGLGAGSSTELLDLTVAEMNRRYRRLLEADGYARKAVVGPDMSRLVLVVDELREILKGTGKEAARREADLISLVALGRAVKIVVIAATQRPSAQAIPTDVRDLFQVRVCFATMSEDATDMALGSRPPCHLIPPDQPGVGYILTASSRVPQRFRGEMVTDDEIVDSVAANAGRRVDLGPTWPIRITSFPGEKLSVVWPDGETTSSIRRPGHDLDDRLPGVDDAATAATAPAGDDADDDGEAAGSSRASLDDILAELDRAAGGDNNNDHDSDGDQ